MATEERTIVVEQGSSSDNTEDESLSSDSDGDEVEVYTPYSYQATVPAQWSYPAMVQPGPYYHVHATRKGSPSHGHHHGRRRDNGDHGHRKHGKERRHGKQDGHDQEHSDDQDEQDTEGHHHGTRGHHHGSKGHHRRGGHKHHGDGHRSRRGAHGGRHGHRRHGNRSSEDGCDLVLRCVDVHDFKQEEVKVTVSGDKVKVKAVNDKGEISRVFKVTKDYDMSKVRVSRSYSGVLRVVVPAKDSSEKVEEDTTTQEP
ncbi:filaggrin-2-like [Pecten maximus]|uniref:filaggrin-2-like n=1 Tax=Pecten maximus TaxID=6579 RepID=UPI0014590D98|nr:filaggrin-2-like [Pecten maximus]